jgi:hypothetical protein
VALISVKEGIFTEKDGNFGGTWRNESANEKIDGRESEKNIDGRIEKST